MKNFLHARWRALGYAWRGLHYTIHTQPNTWVHTLATLVVLALAAWLQLPRTDWALLFFALGLVWVAELFNTAIETLVDLASPSPHRLAAISKDVSAAAVLLAAFTAALIGLLVLLPPLWQKLCL